MMDFTLIATILFSLGLKEKNITYNLENMTQNIQVLFNLENMVITYIIIEDITNKKYSILLTVNDKKLINNEVDTENLFYHRLLTSFLLLIPLCNHCKNTK